MLALMLLCVFAASCGQSGGVITGELKTWHRVCLTVNGPQADEQGEVNPFLDYRLDVTFTNGGRSFEVPGFFAADGNAWETSATGGTAWRAYFTPDTPGEWQYTARLHSGKNIAIESGGSDADPIIFSGSFTVTPTDKTGRDFRAKGMLEYTGGHYFRFAESQDYFLKGGADSPENFLAYNEFDGTFDADAGSGSYEHIGGFIHTYEPHISDWNQGDPTWQGGKGKGIIGALNYLAEKGMNSVYFLTYNLDGGDGRDTWMWSDENERERFDCSKLDQWEIIFSHMDKLGIMLHVVTQETENDRNLGGSAGLNPVRRLYYRELAARFSHHPALIWNLGEENNTPDPDRKDIASYIRTIDPYDHPITVHTHNNRAMTFYDGILGDANFEATSIQGNMENYNNDAIVLRQRSTDAGRKWAIFGDEQPPASRGILPDANDPSHDIPRKYALWGNLMGGGAGVEWYFGHQYPHMDINCEDWRSRDIMWDQTRYALEFFHTHLPFWEMTPDNELTTAADDYCFAIPGEIYAVYLPNGGSTDLEAGGNNLDTFTVQWYNPRTGGALSNGTVTSFGGSGKQSIGMPPADTDKDWVALIRKQ